VFKPEIYTKDNPASCKEQPIRFEYFKGGGDINPICCGLSKGIYIKFRRCSESAESTKDQN